jgi:hypothetical protein
MPTNTISMYRGKRQFAYSPTRLFAISHKSMEGFAVNVFRVTRVSPPHPSLSYSSDNYSFFVFPLSVLQIGTWGGRGWWSQFRKSRKA